jgi:hypothetical protein
MIQKRAINATMTTMIQTMVMRRPSPPEMDFLPGYISLSGYRAAGRPEKERSP